MTRPFQKISSNWDPATGFLNLSLRSSGKADRPDIRPGLANELGPRSGNRIEGRVSPDYLWRDERDGRGQS